MNLGMGLGIPFKHAAPASFDPANLPNLLLLLDARKGMHSLIGKISQWDDQSGAGDANRNVSQANALHQPTLTASNPAYNGEPTADFSRVATDYLQSGVWSVAPAQPCTIFLVGNDDGSGSNETYVDDQAAYANLIDTNDGYAVGIYAGASLDSGAPASSAPRIIGGVFHGGTSKTYVNTKTPTATGNAGAANAVGITLGATHGAGASLSGSIAFVVVVSGVMADADAAKLVTYLGARYGIAVV